MGRGVWGRACIAAGVEMCLQLSQQAGADCRCEETSGAGGVPVVSLGCASAPPLTGVYPAARPAEILAPSFLPFSRQRAAQGGKGMIKGKSEWA